MFLNDAGKGVKRTKRRDCRRAEDAVEMIYRSSMPLERNQRTIGQRFRMANGHDVDDLFNDLDREMGHAVGRGMIRI